jgi:hypothetical protein
MTDSGTVPALTDHDHRWVVHAIAALREGIADEIEYDGIEFHDDTIHQDTERLNRLWNYVYNALT